MHELEKLGATSWCEGIIGDGCGGGRIFLTCSDCVKVYDPYTKEIFTLIENLHKPEDIAKKGCHLSFICKGEKRVFNLSTMEFI